MPLFNPHRRINMTTAQIYMTLCAALICFQLSLVLGALLGYLTMSGANPGILPTSVRAAAALFAVLLIAMAIIVQRYSRGQHNARWPMWGVLGLTTLTTLANLATTSFWERALWAPITIVMLMCALHVWWRSPCHK